MAFTLNRRLAQLVDGNGQLNTGKIPNDYITSDHVADNTITSAMLHTSFTVSTSNLTAIDTDDVSEGSTNLYYTDARADARITAATTDDLTEGSTNLYFTNARVDTEIDSYLSGGTGVTYSSGEISIGQDVGTSATPTFGNITTTGYIAGPATFTIDPAAVGDNTGTVVIAGNLQVDGTTTTINSTTMEVDDLNITLASGAANAAAANGAGITVDCGSDTDATFTYDGTNDEWDFNKDINVTGTISSGAISQSVTAGTVPIDIDTNITSTEGSVDIIKAKTVNNSYSTITLDRIGTTNTGLTFKTTNDSTLAQRLKISNEGDISFYEDTGTTAKLFWDASAESLGIGTDSPNQLLHLDNSASSSDSAAIRIISGTAGTARILLGDTGYGSRGRVLYDNSDDSLQLWGADSTTSTERLRIDSSGNLLVSHTGNVYNNVNITSTVGSSYTVNGEIFACSDQSSGVMILNRKGSDGVIATFKKDGSEVGRIGTRDTGALEIGSGDVYLQFNGANDWIKPVDGSGNNKSGVDLGTTGAKFDNLRLSGTAYIDTAVGIGNDNPTSAKLEVKGAKAQSGGAPIGNVLIADSTSLAANTGGGITFQGVYQTGGAITGFASIEAMKETSTHNEYGGALVFKSRQDQGSMNEGMRIDSSGNVGIDNNSPSHRLHIQGATNDEARVRVSNTAGGQASLDLNNSEGYFRTFTDAGEYRIYDQTDGAFRMRIDTSGQVAIGSHSPSRTLHVNSGSTNVVARLESSDGIAAVEFKDSAGSAEVGCNGSDVVFFPAGVEKARLTSGGNFGIGTLSSSATENLIHAKGTNNSAGDLGTAVGPGNIPAIHIQNAGTTDNNMAAIFFMDDASVRAGVHARFTSHSSDDAELRLSTSAGGNLRERMVINSSGQVGIACTDQSNLLTVDANSASVGTDSISVRNRGVSSVNHTTGLRFQFNSAVPSAIRSRLTNTSSGAGTLSFYTSSDGSAGNLTERFSIDSKGTLFNGSSSFAHNTYAHAAVFSKNSTPLGTVVIEDPDVSSGIGNTVLNCYLRDEAPASSATFIRFSDGGGTVGTVRHNADGSITFNDTSDYRLKENVDYDWNALALVSQLKPARFNFIKAPGKTKQGFLAHEVMDIVPGSVTGEKDHIEPIGTITDSNGNVVHEGVYEHFCKTDEGQTWTRTGEEPIYQELDYSKLVPLLTKAIQEQQTIIDDLKTRIETLEG